MVVLRSLVIHLPSSLFQGYILLNCIFPLNGLYFHDSLYALHDFLVEYCIFQSNNVITGNQIFPILQGLLIIIFFYCIFIVGSLCAKDQHEM